MTNDLIVMRLLFDAARIIHKTYFPNDRFGGTSDLVLVARAVFIGHAEGRPMNLSRLSRYLDMPVETVRRKIGDLVERGIVERRGWTYAFASSALTCPRAVAAHRKILGMFLSAAEKIAQSNGAPPAAVIAAPRDDQPQATPKAIALDRLLAALNAAH